MNSSGFTLIEVLVSLVILIICSQLLVGMIGMLKSTDSYLEDYQQNVLLIKQVEKDLIICKKIINLNPLSCETFIGETINYEKHKQKLVRKINGLGYEVVYTNLKDWRVENDGYLQFHLKTNKQEFNLIIGSENE